MKNETALKIYRLSKGATILSWAEKAGVSERTYRYYESGTRKPNIEVAQRLAAALGVDVETIFPPEVGVLPEQPEANAAIIPAIIGA